MKENDGYDIQKVELDSLRKQVGIVPQDSLLFKGTIRDNISLANPEIDEEKITMLQNTNAPYYGTF